MRVSKTPEEGSIPSTPAKEKTALLLVSETSSKSIAFSLVFSFLRPNENRTTLAILSQLKEVLIITQTDLKHDDYKYSLKQTGATLVGQTATSCSRLWLKTSTSACFLRVAPSTPAKEKTALKRKNKEFPCLVSSFFLVLRLFVFATKV